jgi:RNA polymerase sigma factor (sigma-70 family)
MSKSTDCVTATEPVELADVELVRRAQGGDSHAFGQLVERNRRAVFRAALAAVGSPAEADDVTQEAFVTAFRKLSSFRGDSAFKTWLLSITWRKAIDRRKQITRWFRLTSPPLEFDSVSTDPMERVPSSERSHEETLAAADLQRTVRSLIATLPPKLRDALLLSGSGEYSYQQIGDMLKIPVGTLKWRVSEARRLLKVKLKAAGYER